MLELLLLRLGSGSNLDDGYAADELGQTFLELLLVILRGGLFELCLDLGSALPDGFRISCALDDGGLFLGHADLLGTSKHGEISVFKLDADILGNDLTTGHSGDILEHGLPSLAESRGLYGHRLHGSTELVDHEGCEGLSLDILGDDEQRFARLHHLLQERDHVLDVADLAVVNENVGVVKACFHPLWIGHHVGAHIALVELESFDHLKGSPNGLAVLHGNYTVFANFLHSFGDEFSDGLVVGGNSRYLGDLLPLLDGDGKLLEFIHDEVDGLLYAVAHEHAVCSCGYVLHALEDDRAGENRRRGGTVTGYVVGFGSYFLYELCAHVLEGILELDLLRYSDAVVCNRGRTEFLFQHHVTALGTKGPTYRVCHLVDTPLKRSAGFFSECKHLCHGSASSFS